MVQYWIHSDLFISGSFIGCTVQLYGSLFRQKDELMWFFGLALLLRCPRSPEVYRVVSQELKEKLEAMNASATEKLRKLADPSEARDIYEDLKGTLW